MVLIFCFKKHFTRKRAHVFERAKMTTVQQFASRKIFRRYVVIL